VQSFGQHHIAILRTHGLAFVRNGSDSGVCANRPSSSSVNTPTLAFARNRRYSGLLLGSCQRGQLFRALRSECQMIRNAELRGHGNRGRHPISREAFAARPRAAEALERMATYV